MSFVTKWIIVCLLTGLAAAGRVWADRKRPRGDTPRVQIANRADGGTAYWVAKLYGFAALIAAVAISIVTLSLYGYFSERTDEVGPGTNHDLAAYAHHVPSVSHIYA